MSDKKKALVIKLDKTGSGVFARDSWYGFGPFRATFNDDDSLSASFGDQDTEICPIKENDYGAYWVANFLGGKVFITVVEHEKFGTYARLKLTDDVKLPKSVLTKINSGGPKKPAASKSFTKKPEGSTNKMWG